MLLVNEAKGIVAETNKGVTSASISGTSIDSKAESAATNDAPKMDTRCRGVASRAARREHPRRRPLHERKN